MKPQLILVWFNPLFGVNRWHAMPVKTLAQAYSWVNMVEDAAGRPLKFLIRTVSYELETPGAK